MKVTNLKTKNLIKLFSSIPFNIKKFSKFNIIVFLFIFFINECFSQFYCQLQEEPKWGPLWDCAPDLEGDFQFYGNMDTYIPYFDSNPLRNPPLKTLKLNINIFQKTNGTGNYQDNEQTRQTFHQIIEWVNGIYHVCPPSDPISGIQEVNQTFVQFDIGEEGNERIYFYQNDNLWNQTTNTALLQNAVNDADPSRMNNINVHITGGSSNWAHACTPSYTNFNLNQWIVMFYPGSDLPIYAVAGTLAHELGHIFNLMHTYCYGGASVVCCGTISDSGCDPPQSCCQGCIIKYDTKEYLSDIFGTSPNGTCPHIAIWGADAYNPNTPNAEKITNNLMSGNMDNCYISPKQAGQIHRSLALSSARRYVNDAKSNIPLVISDNQSWDFNFKTYRDIIVKQGSTLTLTCQLLMPSQAKIIVEPGAKLIVDGGKLTSACGSMWQGIEVWGNTNASQFTQGAQGIVELKNGAIIENARCGITTCQKDMNGNILWNTTGGIIRAKNSTFRNCKKAIEFLPYDYYNFSYFKNCTFETTNKLADNTAPETFVSLSWVTRVRFVGCTFRNTTAENIYTGSQRGKGITSIDAGYFLYPHCTQLFIWTCPESYLVKNTFENLYYAIEGSSSCYLNTVHINNCNFNNNFRSIILHNIENATIIKNNFNIGNCIYVGGGIQESFGLYLDGCTGYKVEENIFNNGYYGIIVHNSGGSPNELYKNNFTNNIIGIQAQGINAHYKLWTGLIFKCNEFDNISSVDISVTESDSYPGRIARYQNFCSSDNTTPANNIFSETAYYNICVGSNATFFHYSANYDGYNTVPDCYPPNMINFLITCSTTFDPATSCPSRLISPWLIPAIRERISGDKLQRDNLIAKIDKGNTQALLNVIYQNKPPGQVKNKLLEASPYVSDTVLLAAIKGKPTPLPPGILKEILIPNSPLTTSVMQAVITRTPALPVGIMTEVQTVQTGTSARTLLEREIAYLENQIGLSENELMRVYLNDTTINGIDSVIAYLNTKTDLESKKMLVQAHLQNKQCNTAKSLLTQIPQDEPENISFYTFFNLIADLCTAGKNVFQLTPAQEQTVRAIAESNTSTAVNAQVILTMVYGEEFPLNIEKLEFPDSLSIYGKLFANPLCGGMPVAGDTIVLLDTAYNIVNTIAATNDTGKFVFYLPELLQLQHTNPTAKYSFDTKDRTTIVASVFKTIAEWINQSPIQLILRKPEVQIISGTTFCFGDSVRFNASVDGGKKPYTYQWDFGDGNSSTEANPTHLYELANTYTIKLIATDEFGCSDTASKTIFVSQPIIFSIEGDTIVYAGDFVYLENNTTGTPPLSFTWIIPEIDTLFTNDFAYLFEYPDTYTVKLIAVDSIGCSDSIIIQLIVNLPILTFQKIFGGPGDEPTARCIVLSNGDFVIAATTTSFGAGGQDILVMRFNDKFELLWSKTFGGLGDDFLFEAQQFSRPMLETADGGILLVGNTTSWGAGQGDIYLLKMDYNGNLEWSKVYGTSVSERGINVWQTADGGFLIAGDTRWGPFGSYDCYLIKTDIMGNLLWTKTLGGSSAEVITDMKAMPDGGAILSGYTFSFGSYGADGFLTRIDASGNLLWFKRYGKGINDGFYTVLPLTDGGFLAGGNTTITGEDFMGWLVCTDDNGNVLWDKSYNGSGSDIFFDIISITDGDYAVAGQTQSWGGGGWEFWLMRIEDNGNLQWSMAYGGMYDELVRSLFQTNDGGFLLTGPSKSFGLGMNDIYVVKTDSTGNSGCNEIPVTPAVGSVSPSVVSVTPQITSSCISGIAGTIVNIAQVIEETLCPALSLKNLQNLDTTTTNNETIVTIDNNKFQIFPNPYNNYTNIIYELSETSKIKIEVYTITGQKAATIVQETQQSGRYQYQFSAQQLGYSAGLYLLRIRVNDEMHYFKLIEMNY